MRGQRAHVATTIIAVAIAASAGLNTVSAQTTPSPYIEPNPNVTVDLSVLDGFGGSPNVADMLRPGFQPRGYGASGAPAVGTVAPTVPSFLVRPDAPRYTAPPPEVQALIGAGRAAAPAPALRAPTPAVSQAPTTQAPARPAPAAQPPAAPAPRQTAAASPPPAPVPAAPRQTAAAPPPPPPSIPRATTAPAPPPPPPSVPAVDSGSASAPPPPPPPAPEPQPTQLAAQTPAPAAPAPAPSDQGGGDEVRISFPAGQSQLPNGAGSQLDAIVRRLEADSGLRVQLLAYANGDTEGANKARRLSLSRALAVRSYLIDNNVASTRMDVRALGNRSEGGPADRVDVVVISR
jgi:outer membrane protein OmpA-like peptidoglycan-associated protein